MQLGKYLLLVEKETYYVEVVKIDPVELLLNDELYTLRDNKLYKDDVLQGQVYNWMHAHLEPSIDIVMAERAALLDTIVDDYKVTRIIHHLHCSTLYQICRDGIYKEMLINNDGRYISSPEGWIEMK